MAPPDQSIAGDDRGVRATRASRGRIRLPRPFATVLAWFALRSASWPGRQLIGMGFRRRSRARGGRGYKVRTADGTRLDVWYVPPHPRAVKRLPIVMVHGWLEVKEFHFHRAHRFARRGHPVILYDARGHGRSAFRVTTFGIREREDLAAVIEDARERHLIGDKLITLGYSMGAATALQHAKQDACVAAVVAFAPFAELPDAILTFRDLFAPCLEGESLLRGFERAAKSAGFKLDEASTTAAVSELEIPVLIIEATEDENLPPDIHIQPLIRAKRRGKLEVLTVEGATHISLCRKRWTGLDHSVDRFVDGIDHPAKS